MSKNKYPIASGPNASRTERGKPFVPKAGKNSKAWGGNKKN
jgi:hypothetical protein